MPSSQRRDGVEQRSVSKTSHGRLTSIIGHMSSNPASDSAPSLVEDCTSDNATSNCNNTIETPSNESIPPSEAASEEASPTNAARPESGFARMLKLHDMLSGTSERQEPLNRWLGDTSDPWSSLKERGAETAAQHGADIERVLADVDRLFPSQRTA
ncbi:hypothetical protein KC343_g7172 [Hortaea werneckii]|nr:hypothetical protein KC323_g2206 [Hortaea werneckii]KAI7214808.1 hypothetical protein KC352_g16735 [Hortaea werneckii]KAI7564481.1 hypothetical protein KC317_g7029 [Hortaea werneckii]KAI7611355.1 hypothetical protein KC346_g8329 [Hortaea werneckii]KAI7623858.1 hypothetical protein KC343_g7172 [Hortaea werneckii]